MVFSLPRTLKDCVSTKFNALYTEGEISAEEAYLLSQCLSESTVTSKNHRLQPFETLSPTSDFKNESSTPDQVHVFAGVDAKLKNFRVTGKGRVFVFVGSGAELDRCTVLASGQVTIIAVGFGAICSMTTFGTLKVLSPIIIGPGTTIGSNANLLGEENGAIVFGANCMISTGLAARTGDSHGIYDIETRKKTNSGGSIVLEEHSWIGRSVIINKGVRVGRDTVVGQGAVVSGTLHKNCIYAGNPLKLVRHNTNWDRSIRDEVPEDFDWMDSGTGDYRKYRQQGFANGAETTSWAIYNRQAPFESLEAVMSFVASHPSRPKRD